MTVDPGCWVETLDTAQVKGHGVYVIDAGATATNPHPTDSAKLDALITSINGGTPALADRVDGDLVVVQYGGKTWATWAWAADNSAWVRMTAALNFN